MVDVLGSHWLSLPPKYRQVHLLKHSWIVEPEERSDEFLSLGGILKPFLAQRTKKTCGFRAWKICEHYSMGHRSYNQKLQPLKADLTIVPDHAQKREGAAETRRQPCMHVQMGHLS